MASSEREKENVALVRDGLESWIAGDRAGAIGTFTEDIVVYVPAELGNAGTYHGVEEFQRWFEAWDEAWSEFSMSVESIEPAGENHVVAMIRSRAIGAGSGIEVENVLGWVIGVRDSRMEYLSLRPDRDAALAHAHEREARPSA